MKTRVASTSCYFFIALFAVCLFFSGCIPEEIELPVRIKSVVTHGVSNVDSRSATLFGNISLYDSENIACGFIYNTSSNLSHKSGVERSTIANGDYVLNISGLKANTIYYYRAYGVDAGQYKYGDIRSFTTKQNVSVTTGSATSTTSSSATLSGSVSGADQSLTCGIIYGTSSSLSSSSGTKKSTTSSGSYSISVTGLSANRTYYYRAYAIVDGEYVYGEVRSFTTESSSTVTSGDAIDLGLSVKWASCNVGADSPEEYGDYFAWGETTTKSSYTDSNGVTYGLYISELESRSIIDADGNLTAAYDAATANWGDNWRMPTLDEMMELIENCTWKWTTQNGVNGYKVTGPNGNSIFLPAAGYRYGTSFDDAGSRGYYWPATPFSSRRLAYYLSFSSDHHGYSDFYRSRGHTVRPVSEE